MPRWRLGVALIVPEPARSEIQGLRRALGDGALDRIAPHVTLVPPVNVRVDDLPSALEVLRKAASTVEPFPVLLGPVSTFAPLTPVIKLAVSDAAQRMQKLRDAVFQPPLERSLTWPFEPHVTLHDDANPDDIPAALHVLRNFSTEVRFEKVTLLREVSGRIWEPIADVMFGAPVIAGRGSIPLELSRSTLLDPIASDALGVSPGDAYDLVLTARRDGSPVGVAAGRLIEDRFVIGQFAVSNAVRGEGVGYQLLSGMLAGAADLGAKEVASKISCPQIGSFFARHGFVNDVRKLLVAT